MGNSTAFSNSMPMTPPSDAYRGADATLEDLATEVLNTLAQRFPVCLYSDEFHFFPQAQASDGQPPWDDFSAAVVGDTIARLRAWRSVLDRIVAQGLSPAARLDAGILGRVLATLSDQFTWVRSHETQPSFHLTVMAIGLADALAAGDENWRLRIESLPVFLDRAAACLTRIPDLFRDLGQEMASRLAVWLQSLHAQGYPGISRAADSLARFTRRLDRIPTEPEFRITPDGYAHLAAEHIGCRMPISEIAQWLDAEIDETRRMLLEQSARLGAGQNWSAACAALPVPGDAAERVYARTIAALADHCRKHGLVDDRLLRSCPVGLQPVPDHLRPVRSAAAYSMPPGHPPRGGIFFTGPPGPSAPLPTDWRPLCAHETFPGHHLLDTHRWNHPRRLRRHIEFPLFYEGWASFAEELLFDTGFFNGPADRLCMARRRYWRALRGRADLDLQAGRRSVEQVAAHFSAEGLDPVRAEARVRRYALKPGYQLCYTIGRCRFRTLYDRHVALGRSPAVFARTVLEQGQIGMGALETILFKTDPTTD